MRRILIAILFLLVAASPSQGQMVRGTITDDATDRTIPSVLITLIDAGDRENGAGVRSDSFGTFAAHATVPGRYRIRATRIGYQPVTSDPIQLDLGSLVVLRLKMTTLAQQLVPVEIVERRRLQVSELMTSTGFDLRHRRNVGTFISAEQLAAFRRDDLREVLGSYAPDILYIEPVDGAEVLSLRSPEGGSSGCAPEIYLDGLPLSTGSPIESLSGRREAALTSLAGYAANQIHGIEIYRWAQRPPLSIAGLLGVAQVELNRTNHCGAIAVWTVKGKSRTGVPRRSGGGAGWQVIRGTVVDQDTDARITSAHVTLQNAKGKRVGDAVTVDSTGQFTIRTKNVGVFRLHAADPQFRTVSTPEFRLATDELVVLRLFVSQKQRVAAPLGIGTRLSTRDFAPEALAGFAYRRERAIVGRFFSTAPMAPGGASNVGELLGDLAGLAEGMATSDRCDPTWFVDGTIVRADDVAALRSMPLATVVGIEVYDRVEDAPELFASAATRECRIIAVWTTSAK